MTEPEKKPEVDEEELEKNIAASIDIEDEVVEEEEETLDLKEVLSGEESPNLTKMLADEQITEEQILGEAKSRGWHKDGEDRYKHKVSALEFLERQPQFNAIKGLMDKTDRLEKLVTKMADDGNKIAKRSLEKQKSLKDQLEDAKKQLLNQEFLDEEAITKVKNIDNQLEVVRNDMSSAQPNVDSQEEWEDALIDFVAENPWYGSHSGFTEAAGMFGKKYVRNNKTSTPEQYYKHIKEEMIGKYGEQLLFPQEEKRTPRKPNIGTNRDRQPLQKQNKAKTINDMPEDMRAIAREVIDSGVSEEDYLKSYFRG